MSITRTPFATSQQTREGLRMLARESGPELLQSWRRVPRLPKVADVGPIDAAREPAAP